MSEAVLRLRTVLIQSFILFLAMNKTLEDHHSMPQYIPWEARVYALEGYK